MSDAQEANVKQCCAAFYASDLARLLLGESFHPGGTPLTDRLAHLTQLTPHSRVLDVAAGRGATVFHIAQSIGCEVAGLDLSEENVKLASEEAAIRGLADRVSFRVADAEKLPFDDRSFDAILCECAFCTFPDKLTSAREFSRVLVPQGRLGLCDLTKTAGPLPELEGLLSWIACIGDAQPVDSYVKILQRADFTILQTEDHSQALADMVRQIQGRLLGAEIAKALKKLDLPNMDFSDAKRFAQAASLAVKEGKLGYTLISAIKDN
jgi:arsenite methyltransferase